MGHSSTLTFLIQLKTIKIIVMKKSILRITIYVVIAATLAVVLLTSCSRYSSPYPDGHPCIPERRPNIFRH